MSTEEDQTVEPMEEVTVIEMHVDQSLKEEDTETDICTPQEVHQMDAVSAELPAKSKYRYLLAYVRYKEWQKENGYDSTSENVVMEYLQQLREKSKPTTLWAQFSMLRMTINVKENIDIGTYKILIAYLKEQAVGYTSEKTKVLTPQQINKFLKEAPDSVHLATKVATIFGISGSLRRDELTNMKIQDVQLQGKVYLVDVPDVPRSFFIPERFYDVITKYMNLRPQHVSTDRFFLNYSNGKCTNQVIGINKFSSFPKKIAQYLDLEDAKLYTGLSFRRSTVANQGANILGTGEECDNAETSRPKRKVEKLIATDTKSINVDDNSQSAVISNIIRRTFDLKKLTRQIQFDGLAEVEISQNQRSIDTQDDGDGEIVTFSTPDADGEIYTDLSSHYQTLFNKLQQEEFTSQNMSMRLELLHKTVEPLNNVTKGEIIKIIGHIYLVESGALPAPNNIQEQDHDRLPTATCMLPNWRERLEHRYSFAGNELRVTYQDFMHVVTASLYFETGASNSFVIQKKCISLPLPPKERFNEFQPLMNEIYSEFHSNWDWLIIHVGKGLSPTIKMVNKYNANKRRITFSASSSDSSNSSPDPEEGTMPKYKRRKSKLS